MKTLKLEERLIVAADFKPSWPARAEVHRRVIALADKLKNTGVYLKVNSALRAWGYDLIDQIHDRGLKVFADLKLYDISETLSTDGTLLRQAKPELLTTVCTAGVTAIHTLKAELPDTEVLGVTVLTSLREADVQAMFSCSMAEAVLRLGQQAHLAGLDGWICSAAEATMLRTLNADMTINTPAIRPSWAIVTGDDQNPDRIMTPAKAIKAGANRIVVGRPIVGDTDPYAAVMRTLDEVASAVA